MRKLLVVSPHFPPTDAVDMHRVRTTIRYYKEFGWDPVVLSVEPTASGRLVEPRLAATVPSDIPVIRTGAFPAGLARLLGFSAIGFRAHRQLERAGDRLIRDFAPDLAFISTTAFPLMTLGAIWRKRHGLPFVIDLQDPWFTSPNTAHSIRDKGIKERLMFAIHRRMEAATMSAVDGLMAVSSDYFPPLTAAYPRLSEMVMETIPFGLSSIDLSVAAELGDALDFDFDRSRETELAYAGRVGPDMMRALGSLFAAIRHGVDAGLDEIERLRLGFVGTGYELSGNPLRVEPFARRAALDGRVVERPDRVSLLDSLRLLQRADVLLILGSDDFAYQPSKLFQYLGTDRPVLCVCHSQSRLAQWIRDMDGVHYLDVEADAATAARSLAAWLKTHRGKPAPASRRRQELADLHSAREMARLECAVFDAAVESRVS